MPSGPDRARKLVEGSAALLCVVLAGWSLACIQSERQLAAEILAIAAASIPVIALLVRLSGLVDQVISRQSTGKRAAVALNRD